jgi:hypothetical protein
MKSSLLQKLVIITTVTLGSIPALSPAQAQSLYTEQGIDPTKIVVVARPYGQAGETKYDLLVIEQFPGKRSCWSEKGTNPTLIDPLLLQFNFVQDCRRSTDANGYSIRMDGQDRGLDYLLRVVDRNGELVLIGSNRSKNGPEEIVLGRSQGLKTGQFHKIILEPGWQMTKRTYKGKALGHFYFSNSPAIPVTTVTPVPPKPKPTVSPKPKK